MITKLRKPIPKTSVRQFTVYLPEEMDLLLRTMAHEEDRTLSKQTELVLLKGLRSMRRKSSSRN